MTVMAPSRDDIARLDSEAACRQAVRAGEADVNDWFPTRGPDEDRIARRAIAICRTCPVVNICLDCALEAERKVGATSEGIFGGLRGKERARLIGQKTRELPPHGTVARYKRGCGCEDCRRANNDYRRRRAQQERERRAQGER